MTQYNSLGEIDSIRAFDDGQVAIRGEYGGWVLFDPSPVSNELPAVIDEVSSDGD